MLASLQLSWQHRLAASADSLAYGCRCLAAGHAKWDWSADICWCREGSEVGWADIVLTFPVPAVAVCLQYFDSVKDVANASKSSTLFMSHSPAAVNKVRPD